MKKLLNCFFFFSATSSFALKGEHCADWVSFLKPICKRYNQILDEGTNDLYLSGYAWHNRYTYPPEKIKKYNEAAWGGGFGRGFFDEKGNWHTLSAIAFLDSHAQLEPVLGYSYLKVAALSPEFKVGLGFTAIITSRADINHRLPFPGALPWASIFFKKASVGATYIPGFNNNGNVMYVIGKYTLN